MSVADPIGTDDEFDAAVAYLRNTNSLARYCLRTDHVATVRAEAQRIAEAQADTLVEIINRVLASLKLPAEQQARALALTHAELLAVAARDGT